MAGSLLVFGAPAYADYYEIRNFGSGMCAGLNSWEYFDNGAPVVQLTCDRSPEQLWSAVPLSDGYYMFVNARSGKCMDVRDGKNVDWTPVQQWACTNTNGMKWKTLIPAYVPREVGDIEARRHQTGRSMGAWVVSRCQEQVSWKSERQSRSTTAIVRRDNTAQAFTTTPVSPAVRLSRQAAARTMSRRRPATQNGRPRSTSLMAAQALVRAARQLGEAHMHRQTDVGPANA